jgi:rubrerythrin
MKAEQIKELILQSLEHEQGGVKVYETALKCVVNDDLKQEWAKYFEQTQHHVQVLQDVCASMDIDPKEKTPGREIVKAMGAALVQVMEKALAAGDQAAAQLVACESVVLAETKDHFDWELLSTVAEKMSGDKGEMLQDAVGEIEDEEDEHLYHTKGWCRELWLEALGLRAVLPPPEERKDVKTAIGAARAEHARDEMR